MTDKIRTALDWEDVRFFVALARQGSLSAAARSLKVNHATVARRVAALENAVGWTLFERRADGYGLTPEGQATLADALAMERAALALNDRLDAPLSPSGTVRLTTIRSLAEAFLVDRLGLLASDFPGIVLEVLAESRVMSLAQREADIALRLGRPKDSSLVGKVVGRVGAAFYGSAHWVAAVKAGAKIRLIGYDPDSAFVAEAAWLKRHFPSHPLAFCANATATQAAAARAGFGIALLPRYLGDPDGALHEIDLGPLPPPRDLWLLTRPDLADVARVRAVMGLLAQIIGGNRARLEGA